MTASSRGMGETFGVFLLPLSGHFGCERAAWRRKEQGASDNPRRTDDGKSKGGLSLLEAINTTVFLGFFFIFATTALGIFGISLQTVFPRF